MIAFEFDPFGDSFSHLYVKVKYIVFLKKGYEFEFDFKHSGRKCVQALKTQVIVCVG